MGRKKPANIIIKEYDSLSPDEKECIEKGADYIKKVIDDYMINTNPNELLKVMRGNG